MKGCHKIVTTFFVGLLLTSSTFAQRPNPRMGGRMHAAGPQKPRTPSNNDPTPKKTPAPGQRRHAGDWLRRYRDLPADKQVEALRNDPEFQKLPPFRQAQLQKRLERFSSLPRENQERILSRMETWEHLTPGQKGQARQVFQQIRELPPDRQSAVASAIRNMRDMTPEQREQMIHSDRFRDTFSEQERALLTDAARLPLAPGDNQPPETPDE